MIFLSDERNSGIIHIHIPRTGGRYVAELLMKNNYHPYFGDNNFYRYNNIVDDVEVMHFHASLIQKHFSKFNFKSFTVLRDPIDRFISCFPLLIWFAEKNEMTNLLYSSKITHVLNLAQNLCCNWFRPQSEFILEDTQVWMYENGLNDQFVLWVNKLLQDPIKNNDVKYHKNPFDMNMCGKSITSEMISSVSDFYSMDYEIIEKYKLNIP